MAKLVEETPPGGQLLSPDAVRLAMKLTGGPTHWFLWLAGSGQGLTILPADLVAGIVPISVSPSSGRTIELDASLYREAAERWREVPRLVVPKQRRTPLGRHLDEIRQRIKASGEPLLSWEQIDQELAERRG